MLDPKRLGLAAGILSGLAMFILTIVSMKTGYGAAWLNLVMSIYPGYTITFVGAFIGFIYGFIDGFVCLYLFGWLYNRLGR
jgi:hypothetical protein